MKIGDRVKSDYLRVEGVIKDLRPCSANSMCNRETITFDDEGSGVRAYHHITTFEVVEPEAR